MRNSAISVMKIAALVAVWVSLAGCSRDREFTKEQLKGTWLWESMTIDGRDICDISDTPLFCQCRQRPYFVFTDNRVRMYSYRPNSCELEERIGKYAITENTVLVEGVASVITVSERRYRGKWRLIVEDNTPYGLRTITTFVKE